LEGDEIFSAGSKKAQGSKIGGRRVSQLLKCQLQRGVSNLGTATGERKGPFQSGKKKKESFGKIFGSAATLMRRLGVGPDGRRKKPDPLKGEEGNSLKPILSTEGVV